MKEYNIKGIRAFTLIELLVVILIIGVLSAVALPQYQKAVFKSRYASLKAMTSALAQAEELFYMEHGEYTTDIGELDIDFPEIPNDIETPSVGRKKYVFDWGACTLTDHNWYDHAQRVVCTYTVPDGNGISYGVYLLHNEGRNMGAHSPLHCLGAYCQSYFTNNKNAKQICMEETGKTEADIKTGSSPDEFFLFFYNNCTE